MAINKVPCPKCNAILKSPMPLAEGTPVKCPQCKFAFRVPALASVGVIASNGTAGQPQAYGQGVTSKPPLFSPASPLPLARPISTTPAGQPATAGGGKRIVVLVLAGAGLLLLLGVILLIACLSGGGGDGNPTNVPNNSFAAIPEPQLKTLVLNGSLIELSKEDSDKADELVRKGVAYLKKAQGPEGAWGPNLEQHENYVAFAGLTLLECGVPQDDPVIQKAAQFARTRVPTLNRTYPAALFILFFDRLGEPADNALIAELAMRLVAGQTAEGGWNYFLPVLSQPDRYGLETFLRNMGRHSSLDNIRRTNPDLLKKLPPNLQKAGLFNAPPNPPADFFKNENGGDNSNTQFALLGLWTAMRHKLPVENSLDLVVRRFRNSQYPDGRFCYKGLNSFASPLPTMTCAGLLGLAVGYGIGDKTEGKGPQNDVAIQSALANLASAIGVAAPNPQANIDMTEMYFLWSMERVAVLYQLKKINGKDWYHWGFTMLRKHQNPDGSWTCHRGPGNGPLADTCFALLFLKRINLIKDLTDKLSGMNAEPPLTSNNPPRKD